MDKLIYESVPSEHRPQPPMKPMANTATVTFRGQHERRTMTLRDALSRALSQMKAEQAKQG